MTPKAVEWKTNTETRSVPKAPTLPLSKDQTKKPTLKSPQSNILPLLKKKNVIMREKKIKTLLESNF